MRSSFRSRTFWLRRIFAWLRRSTFWLLMIWRWLVRIAFWFLTVASLIPRRVLAFSMRFAIVEAPSILGLTPGGVEELPGALLHAGLAARLGARRAATVEPPPYDERRDPEHGFRNAAG